MNRTCLLLLVGAFAANVALAQSATNTPSATTTPAHAPAPKAPPLTKEESAEVNTAYADAIKTNPDLVTDQASLKEKQKELQDAQKAYMQKLDDALVKADPNLADIVKTHPNLHPSVPPPPKKEAAPKPPKPAKPAASTNAAPASPTPPPATN